MKKGISLNKGVRVPHLPRKIKEDARLSPEKVQEINKRMPIMPKERNYKRSASIWIIKPDLAMA